MRTRFYLWQGKAMPLQATHPSAPLGTNRLRFPRRPRKFLMALLSAALVAVGLGLGATHPAQADAPMVYWTDSNQGKIQRAELDGSGQETWLANLTLPQAIATDGSYLYWTETGAAYRAPISEPSSATQIADFGIADRSWGIAVNSTHVYWTESWSATGRLMRAQLDGSSPQAILSGLDSPDGITLNSTHVFIAERGDETIVRAELDGSNPVDLITLTSPADVDSVMVDSTYVYWTDENYVDPNTGYLGRALLDGSSVNPTFITATGGPVGLFLHNATDLYWTVYRNNGPGIWKSSTAGTGVTQIATTPTGTADVVVAPRTGGPTSGTSSGPETHFSFFLPDGRECTSISPQRVQVGTMVQLPGETALCQTSDGSLVAGWVIPVEAGFTGYGSASEPFPPGLSVRVVDSQRFTVVPFEQTLTIEYDANIADDDTCTPANLAHASDDGRVGYSWVPRADFAMARTWFQAPCTPEGHELIGWNTRGDGSGETVELGEALPPDWETSRANTHRLYAMWQAAGI